MHASPSPKQFDASSSESIPDVVTANDSVPDFVTSSVLLDASTVQPVDMDVELNLSQRDSQSDVTPFDPPADRHDSKILSDMPTIGDLTVQTPENNNMETSPSDTSAVTRPPPDDEDDTDRPPAKRPRRLSNPDQASLVHATNGVTNGVKHINGASHSSPPSPSSVFSTLSQQQYKFCVSTIRQLKKNKDAPPFHYPVDPVALGIPHYLNVITHPMDISTVEKKLQSSNPSKPDPNLASPRYRSAEEFISDVRLIFSNTVTFNGPDHAISQMGKRLEAMFDKAIKNMPPPAELKPPKPIVKKEVQPPPPPTPPVVPASPPPKKAPIRRSSTSVPTIRRSEPDIPGRPKREIHPPPPKDLPYADAPRKPRKGKKKDDGTIEQLKYCGKILADLSKQRKYWAAVSYFLDPVDWRSLNIPSYPKIIKKPMDLGTMRKKLERGEYTNANRFWDDFKLMIKNCFTFNPVGSPVYQAGEVVQAAFDEKWKALPPLRDVSEDEDDSDEDSDSSQAMAIAMMENQLATLKNGIDAMKKKKPKKDKLHKREKLSTPVPSNSKQNLGKKKKGKMLPDEEVLSFEQKKDLSETIQNLDGPKLERVIQIIHEGVPEIRDSTEEIELDIDSLPASVLTKLYNFVLRPLRPSKRRSNNPGGGTGGLKRKSMDEDVEAEKIRRLEAQLDRFQNPQAVPVYAQGDDSQSSDSSDESGSSGSDSD
ncbi:hypothetical protein Clacol_003642 [Clathrus columnatus]|uniref:Bromodomain-containing protein n=1 Tax=Clathrus columnatus TaxID=1419009 RepID=A0AAV5A553_9AGAM|nr:hypothetical protein Clacol_003642 [Clathrus columnatus]